MKKQILPFLFYLLFNRFLGSEGTTMMTTGGNIVLFAIFLFLGIFLFHLYSFRLKKKKGGFRLVLIVYIPFLFFISLFNYFLRIYALDCFGLYSASIFSCLVLCVGGGASASSSGAVLRPIELVLVDGVRDAGLIGAFFRNGNGGHVRG